ncbi:hypothetical protein C2W62_14365 [Candidatus Entotheonella serta]|nr:hypothetical protein C2W62_14365 [Candidatus Entotheonella serta]
MGNNSVNYSAANAFLDLFAYYCRINWGGWEMDQGTALTYLADKQRRNQVQGLWSRPMPPDKALQGLEWVLEQNATQIGIYAHRLGQILSGAYSTDALCCRSYRPVSNLSVRRRQKV